MIRDVFSAIAASYDRMNRLLSLGLDRHWRDRAAFFIRRNPKRILDLACGTGEFAFALARRFPDAEIVGADLSPEMLAVARKKNPSPRISFVMADAGRLQSDLHIKESDLRTRFDLVSCTFGFRNFADKTAVLDEVRNALSDNGGLLILEFFRPHSYLVGTLVSSWLWALSRIFARDNLPAYDWLRSSMRTTVTEEEFIALAEQAGFTLLQRAFFPPCCTGLLFRAGNDEKTAS